MYKSLLKKRRTPDTINEPLVIVGVERMLFLLSFVACYFISDKLAGWKVGMGLFLAVCFAARELTKKDPEFLGIVIESLNFPRVCDPYLREPFDTRIEED